MAELRSVITIMGTQVGFSPEDISARSMRSRSSMDLLMEQVNTDTIKFYGRHCINVMLNYIHMVAQTFTSGLATLMVQHGDYTLM